MNLKAYAVFSLSSFGGAEALFIHPRQSSGKNAFTLITSPSKTPFFMDAVWPDLWPDAKSHPARNLFTGDVGLDGGRMGRCTIARHLIAGPRSAPRNVPSGQKLPGGIAMSFADAHVEMVRLENLWQQYWNNHYEPPAVRPQ